MASTDDFPKLDLISTIGFNGSVERGLSIHPDREHMIYPLGSTVIVRNLNNHRQDFLNGHSNNISCIAVSKSGKYIASGQVTHMGFKADIIVWDYVERKLLYRLTLHKVKVESLAFSPNEKYLVSLGGQDDGCVVVWNLETSDAICGSPAAVKSAGTTYTVAFSNKSDDIFITAGDVNIRVWELDLENRKIRPTECQLGQLKRIVKSIEVDENDRFFYCGTTSGDILKINMKTKLLKSFGPEKEKFSLGISDFKLLKTGDFLVGSGMGTVAMLKGNDDKFKLTKKTASLSGAVTSIALRGEGHQFFTGTDMGHISRFNFTDFKDELIMSTHFKPVLDVAFPDGTDELFATCSGNDIRIWHTKTSRELLRITEHNMTCNAIVFMPDGKSLVSAWNDGKIRAFLPETGKLYYTINNAHLTEVTAIAVTPDCSRIVSGGGEGQVRVWNIYTRPLVQELVATVKEHHSTITCIKIHDQTFITTSCDGTCIIWSFENYKRLQMVLANSEFHCVCSHPKGYQIITSGTDRKLAYWDAYGGSQIREIDGSLSGSINGMDVSPDGKQLVTCSDDKLVKIWDYGDGVVTHVGLGHSGNVNKIRMSPNLQYLVSVSQDGAILVWKYPGCSGELDDLQQKLY